VTSERTWAAAVRRTNKPMEPTGRSRDRSVGGTRTSSREQPLVVDKGGLRLIGLPLAGQRTNLKYLGVQVPVAFWHLIAAGGSFVVA